MRATEITINEVANNPYDYELDQDGAQFIDKDGNSYSIKFMRIESGVFAVAFSSGIFVDQKTNRHDSFRIFATVIDAIKSYATKNDVAMIVFSANKSEPNRVNLYKKLALAFTRNSNYKLIERSAEITDAALQNRIQYLFWYLKTKDFTPFMVVNRKFTNEKISEKRNQKYDDLDEGWKDQLFGLGLAGAVAAGSTGVMTAKQALTSPNQTKPVAAVAQNTQPAKPQLKKSQPTAPAKVVEPTVNYITNTPLEKYLMTYAAKAGLRGYELAQFMAQCAHETQDFSRLAERGSPQYFRKYDPKYAPKKAKILGNTKVGDGARFKGRGFIQLTGRYNYGVAGKAIGQDLIKNPQLAENPKIAAQIALWYWQNRVKPSVDDYKNTTDVTRKINPGLKGLEDRHENFIEYVAGDETDNKNVNEQGAAEDTNNITYKQQKVKNKFSIEMYVDGKSAGIFQYDAESGRTIVELDPAFRGQGLGQILILKGIYTAAMLGMNYVEDESRTQMFDRAMDRLVDAGYIVNDDEYWYVTSNGEQFLKQGVTEGLEQEFEFELDTEKGRLNVYNQYGGPAGRIEFYPTNSKTINIDLIIVQPQYQRKGLGTQMFNYLKDRGYTIKRPTELTPDGKKFFGNLIQKGIAEDQTEDDNITVQNNVETSFRGGYGGTLIAKTPERQVGYLNYSIYNDKPQIGMIFVAQDYRRRGVAMKMLKSLQELSPDEEIDWGITTDSGSNLRKSINYRKVPNPEIIKKKAKLAGVRSKLARLNYRLEQLKNTDVELARKFIKTVGDRWNQLNDLEYRLENELYLNKGEYSKLIPEEVNGLYEKWSQKYKRSINCNNPKGFSQRAHCQGRKKNEDTVLERKRKRSRKKAYGFYGYYPIYSNSEAGAEGGGEGG